MSAIRVINGITWTRNPDGEYNEYVATIGFKPVVVSSDRDGESWDWRFDDGDLWSLEASELSGALAEATSEAKAIVKEQKS